MFNFKLNFILKIFFSFFILNIFCAGSFDFVKKNKKIFNIALSVVLSAFIIKKGYNFFVKNTGYLKRLEDSEKDGLIITLREIKNEDDSKEMFFSQTGGIIFFDISKKEKEILNCLSDFYKVFCYEIKFKNSNENSIFFNIFNSVLEIGSLGKNHDPVIDNIDNSFLKSEYYKENESIIQKLESLKNYYEEYIIENESLFINDLKNSLKKEKEEEFNKNYNSDIRLLNIKRDIEAKNKTILQEVINKIEKKND